MKLCSVNTICSSQKGEFWRTRKKINSLVTIRTLVLLLSSGTVICYQLCGMQRWGVWREAAEQLFHFAGEKSKKFLKEAKIFARTLVEGRRFSMTSFPAWNPISLLATETKTNPTPLLVPNDPAAHGGRLLISLIHRKQPHNFKEWRPMNWFNNHINRSGSHCTQHSAVADMEQLLTTPQTRILHRKQGLLLQKINTEQAHLH